VYNKNIEENMLIRFVVSNYLSFDEEIELSMVPGLVSKHPNHIVKPLPDSKHKQRVLRSAIVYGANASGKSNLVKAISAARNIIVNGTKPFDKISRIPFKLSQGTNKKSSKFQFEFSLGIQAFIYGFVFDNNIIHEEWLYEIRKTTEKMLFERKTDAEKKTVIEFGQIKFDNKKEENFFEFVGMGTRPNQLFLTESISRDIDFFKNIFFWFRDSLVVLYSDTLEMGPSMFGVQDAITSSLVDYLEQLGTGICGYELVNVDEDDEVNSVFLEFLKSIPNEEVFGQSGGYLIGPGGTRYIIEIENKEYVIKKLKLKHRMGDCDSDIAFEVSEESDGTQRLMDLLPSLTNVVNNKVYVIDELDRSLHPRLSYELVNLFLNSQSKGQLISTTHESHLLDLELLRRDEIWFIQKDRKGSSNLYSLEEYAPRYDKDIGKGYLMGRFGSIPIFGNISFDDKKGE
jgi:AAA15 family ATPase/GTPase